MKKILITILLILTILFTAGCVPVNENGHEVYRVNDTTTFLCVSKEDDSHFKIFVHKETRVMYIYYTGGHGLSVMLDNQGKPLLWKGNL